MYDWTDDFFMQAALSFPYLRGYIAACQESGEVHKLIDMLEALEFDGRQAA